MRGVSNDLVGMKELDEMCEWEEGRGCGTKQCLCLLLDGCDGGQRNQVEAGVEDFGSTRLSIFSTSRLETCCHPMASPPI